MMMSNIRRKGYEYWKKKKLKTKVHNISFNCHSSPSCSVLSALISPKMLGLFLEHLYFIVFFQFYSSQKFLPYPYKMVFPLHDSIWAKPSNLPGASFSSNLVDSLCQMKNSDKSLRVTQISCKVELTWPSQPCLFQVFKTIQLPFFWGWNKLALLMELPKFYAILQQYLIFGACSCSLVLGL